MADDDEDVLDDAEPEPSPANGYGFRGPIDMDVRIKAEGMRLDHYLALNLQDYSRTLLRGAIDVGGVTVNGKPSKASYKVRSGDQLHVVLPVPQHDLPQPEDIPLDILYDDPYLALVNKPANMVVHPAKGHWSGTLVNALQFHFASLSAANGTYRAGIVHRLDRDTSGVILIAKDEMTHRELSAQFERRTVFKEYAAITAGVLDRDSDYIEARIRHHPTDRVKMSVTTDPNDALAKDAVSYYEVIERFRGYSFVRMQPRTGRTHQIRLHLAHVGCPVLADKLYSGRDRFCLSDIDPKLSDEMLMSRQALHAYRLRFRHPRKDQWMEVEAPIPADMRATLAKLRELRGTTNH